ncbi:GGDEF domain-containing protein [Oceanobacter mangrovi]|uniref:GGDEF domain-containing protein n=1 Tax=Oceanobacter mangrovi TaxID=2862510 RepID=UPI001C8E41CF|nr:GGDEF domain-containing protein [Oceanobacter mangrovi]
MNNFLFSLGQIKSTALFTILSVVFSVTLVTFLECFLNSQISKNSILIAGITSTTVSSSLSWYVIGLLFKINTLEKKQRALASYDSLTSIMNRRQFFFSAHELFRRSHDFNDPVSISIIDIDNFKLINDEYGHAAGDAVLISLGKLLKETIRSTDIAGRIGGEEFSILIYGSKSDQAFEILDEIRSLIEKDCVAFMDYRLHYTVSIGVADGEDGYDVEDILIQADKALYKSKKNGKNRVSKY